MSLEQFGPYLVYEELGVGGMATVHRAEIHGVEGFSKLVALKRLHPYLTGSPEIVQSFVREARLASQLQHENIAQTYELGKAEGTYFIAMEYVAGPTLTQVIRQCQLAAGTIPLPITLGILRQVCDALDYAHNRVDDSGRALGIIHRDVSPSNIIVSNTGTVKLLDFGIAKVTGRSEADTPVGIVIKGKFDYIAPEYLGGRLDLRADLFALGVVAHEMLTGRKLFAGEDDFQISTLVLEMPIQPPSRWNSSVPNELDHIVLTALQRDPDLRWRSASAFQAALTGMSRDPSRMASNSQIVDWIRWAFSQTRTEDAGELQRVIDMLDQPSSVQIELTSDQRQQLNEFDEPAQTLHGVGPPAPPNPSFYKPMIVAAAPIKQVPTGAFKPRPSQAVPVPVGGPDDDSGIVLSPPRPPRNGLRYAVYILLVLLVLLAAGAGVLAAAYFLGVDLPFL